MCKKVASKHRMRGPLLIDGEVFVEVDFLAAGDRTSRTPPTPIVYLGERLCGIEADRRVRLVSDSRLFRGLYTRRGCFRGSITDEMTIESSSVTGSKSTLSLIVRWPTTCHCEEDETQRIQLKMLIWQITQMLEITQVDQRNGRRFNFWDINSISIR